MDVIALAQAGIATGRGAARHGGDRAAARLPVAPRRGADRLPRRRPRRPRRRHARGRAGAAADARRPDAAVRGAARRRGSGQLPAPPRAGGAGRAVVESAHAVANDLAARDPGPALRHARGARGAAAGGCAGWPASPAIPTCGRACWTSSRTARREAAPRGQRWPSRPAHRAVPSGRGSGRRASRPASRGRRTAARRGALQPCCVTRTGWTGTRRSSRSSSSATASGTVAPGNRRVVQRGRQS